jgi:hypothetical protein
MRRVPALFLLLLFVPRSASPQGAPLGSEFRVNTYTTGDQGRSSVASDPSGNFVVVWDSAAQDGSYIGVFGQRYDSSGAPLGPEFRVNTYTTGSEYLPAVATDSSGNFVVVWTGFAQDGSYAGIFGQRYAGSGAPQGPEFRVNTYTTGAQRRPSVASDPAGNFVVVWTDTAQEDGSSYGVFGQRYASSGAPLGPEFRVNTYTTNEQSYPTVATDSSGNFVVAWNSRLQSPDTSGYGVFGQRYASSGAPSGPEFRINTFTTGSQGRPSLAADASGNFVVVWNSYAQEGPGTAFDVFGQRYASGGAPIGSEFLVNTVTASSQYASAVAGDSSGNFVVTWMSVQDGSSYGIYAQRYASSGSAVGPEFRVNTYTTDLQGYPAVAADPAGDFVVVWQSYGQDGSYLGVYGQRYGQIVPVELMRFGVE